jgi:hypothetical protein
MSQTPRNEWKVVRWLLRLIVVGVVLWVVALLVIYFYVIFVRGHFD